MKTHRLLATFAIYSLLFTLASLSYDRQTEIDMVSNGEEVPFRLKWTVWRGFPAAYLETNYDRTILAWGTDEPVNQPYWFVWNESAFVESFLTPQLEKVSFNTTMFAADSLFWFIAILSGYTINHHWRKLKKL